MNKEQEPNRPETGEEQTPTPRGKRRDLKEIREILSLMQENDLSEFELKDGNFRLSLKRERSAEIQSAAPSPPPAPEQSARESDDPDTDLVEITSPIVGTFYRSPSPDTESFVSVGQEVDTDTIVCIIEAMKVMNEVKAEVRGTIRRILVENATPVQYGQPLFKVDPL